MNTLLNVLIIFGNNKGLRGYFHIFSFMVNNVSKCFKAVSGVAILELSLRIMANFTDDRWVPTS